MAIYLGRKELGAMASTGLSFILSQASRTTLRSSTKEKYQQLGKLPNPLPRESLLLLPVSPTTIRRRHGMNARNRHLSSSSRKKERKVGEQSDAAKKTLVRTPYHTRQFPVSLGLIRAQHSPLNSRRCLMGPTPAKHPTNNMGDEISIPKVLERVAWDEMRPVTDYLDA